MSLLTLNAGSSSLKFALHDEAHDDDGEPVLLLAGQIAGLDATPRLELALAGRAREVTPLAREGPDAVAGLDDALAIVLERLPGWAPGRTVRAVGHRVVHGGVAYAAPLVIDDGALAALQALCPLAPLHQPYNLAGIRAARARFPGVLQLACFDTAFHRGHPFVHDAFALPRELHAAGVRRYGFHGLSYAYVARRLARLDRRAAAGRAVVAHLGSGASACALHGGRSLASTMGFTALDGLPMGTRPGQLDAGVLLWLIAERGLDGAALTELLYRQSGLKALSGISADMRTLRESRDPRAREAIDYFVARLREAVGALAAALGGLDAVVFTGGIGEHDALTRSETVSELAFLGLALDEAANAAHGRESEGLISPAGAPVRVWVVPTDEEAEIARHLGEALRAADGPPGPRARESS
jgi:acetate kinase